MREPEASAERGDAGFLSRWSERKLALRDGTALPGDDPRGETAEQQDSIVSEASAPVEALTDADMPPLEDLDADSDYAAFLSNGVSESLRNQALKKLFFSGRFNVVDGLDDYAEDFTQFAALGDIVTAEMRHRIEEAAKRIAADAERDANCKAATEPVPQTAAAGDATRADSDQDPAVSTTATDAEGQEAP